MCTKTHTAHHSHSTATAQSQHSHSTATAQPVTRHQSAYCSIRLQPPRSYVHQEDHTTWRVGWRVMELRRTRYVMNGRDQAQVKKNTGSRGRCCRRLSRRPSRRGRRRTGTCDPNFGHSIRVQAPKKEHQSASQNHAHQVEHVISMVHGARAGFCISEPPPKKPCEMVQE